MNRHPAESTRRQLLQVWLGAQLGPGLLASRRELSDGDIGAAIAYGRKWSDGNQFLVEGLEDYQHVISVETPPTYTRVSVTFLTDWARIALGSALLKMVGKEASPAIWRTVGHAGRLVTMVLAVSPGTGADAMAVRLYGNGKGYTVINLNGDKLTPTRAEGPVASTDQIRADWVPTTEQLLTMVHDTKDTPKEFSRILPRVNDGGPTRYEIVFRMDSYQLNRDQWTGKAEFLLFDGEGGRKSERVKLSALR